MSDEIQNEKEIEVADDENQKEQSDKTIRNHIIASMAVGLVPVPMVDLVGITGVQIDMLRKLAQTYEVSFMEHKVKSILSSLVGGGATVPLANTLFSMVKVVPVVGTAIGAITLPVTAGATTYAVGKVFQQHFASGGTFLTFDSEKVKDYYSKMFKKGKDVAADIKNDDSKTAEAEAKA